MWSLNEILHSIESSFTVVRLSHKFFSRTLDAVPSFLEIVDRTGSSVTFLSIRFQRETNIGFTFTVIRIRLYEKMMKSRDFL